jgi:uncharacterized protein YoxC
MKHPHNRNEVPNELLKFALLNSLIQELERGHTNGPLGLLRQYKTIGAVSETFVKYVRSISTDIQQTVDRTKSHKDAIEKLEYDYDGMSYSMNDMFCSLQDLNKRIDVSCELCMQHDDLVQGRLDQIYDGLAGLGLRLDKILKVLEDGLEDNEHKQQMTGPIKEDVKDVAIKIQAIETDFRNISKQHSRDGTAQRKPIGDTQAIARSTKILNFEIPVSER